MNITESISINVFIENIAPGMVFQVITREHTPYNMIVECISRDRKTLTYLSIDRVPGGGTEARRHTLSAEDVVSGKVKLVELIPDETVDEHKTE